MKSKYRVWIDGDLCTGDALCAEIAPDVFQMESDGLAYVVDYGKVLNEPGGANDLASFEEDLLEAVIEAAEECPGVCIFIEAE